MTTIERNAERYSTFRIRLRAQNGENVGAGELMTALDEDTESLRTFARGCSVPMVDIPAEIKINAMRDFEYQFDMFKIAVRDMYWLNDMQRDIIVDDAESSRHLAEEWISVYEFGKALHNM